TRQILIAPKLVGKPNARRHRIHQRESLLPGGLRAHLHAPISRSVGPYRCHRGRTIQAQQNRESVGSAAGPIHGRSKTDAIWVSILDRRFTKLCRICDKVLYSEVRVEASLSSFGFQWRLTRAPAPPVPVPATGARPCASLSQKRRG